MDVVQQIMTERYIFPKQFLTFSTQMTNWHLLSTRHETNDNTLISVYLNVNFPLSHT